MVAALQSLDPSTPVSLEPGTDTFGCSGAWAHVVEAIGTTSLTTAVLRAEGGRWVPVNRAPYCPPAVTQAQSHIPADIYEKACLTGGAA